MFTILPTLALVVCGAESPPEMFETRWIEAEHLDGIRGHCWPMGKPEMKRTSGHSGLSGPGWAALVFCDLIGVPLDLSRRSRQGA
jgi:hypothetical protein